MYTTNGPEAPNKIYFLEPLGFRPKPCQALAWGQQQQPPPLTCASPFYFQRPPSHAARGLAAECWLRFPHAQCAAGEPEREEVPTLKRLRHNARPCIIMRCKGLECPQEDEGFKMGAKNIRGFCADPGRIMPPRPINLREPK